jgi:hypothetical protein
MISHSSLTPPLALAAQAGKLQETVTRTKVGVPFSIYRRPFPPIELLPFRTRRVQLHAHWSLGVSLGDPIIRESESGRRVSVRVVPTCQGTQIMGPPGRLRAGCPFSKQTKLLSALTRTVSRTRARTHTLKMQRPRVTVSTIYHLPQACVLRSHPAMVLCALDVAKIFSQDFSFPLVITSSPHHKLLVNIVIGPYLRNTSRQNLLSSSGAIDHGGCPRLAIHCGAAASPHVTV